MPGKVRVGVASGNLCNLHAFDGHTTTLLIPQQDPLVAELLFQDSQFCERSRLGTVPVRTIAEILPISTACIRAKSMAENRLKVRFLRRPILG